MLILLGCAAALSLTACGWRDRNREQAAAPIIVRTPQPTFTPTPYAGSAGAAGVPAEIAAAAPLPTTPPLSLPPPAPASASAPAAEVQPPAAVEQPGFGGPVVPPTETPAGPPPLGIINSELVNSRSGPDTTFPIVLVLGRGEQFDVTGKSSDGSWWRICCISNKDAWVSGQYIDIASSTANVPVSQAGEVSAIALERLNSPPTAIPATPVPVQATAAPPAAAEAPAPAPPAANPETQPAADAQPDTTAFTLVASERFPENNVVRIFLYVYSAKEALEGYTLRVTKDGVELPVNGASFGGMAGLTWPFADQRQRSQNFKAEFPGVAPAGTWSVELTQNGTVVGPAATFVLAAADTQTELYVRYERK